MAGRIVDFTPHRSFNALALVFNVYCYVTLLTNKHVLIYHIKHEIFSVENRYTQILRDFL